MNQQNVDKKTEEILQELNKILDKLTSKDKTEQTDEFLKKVDELKQELASISKKEDLSNKTEQQIETEQKVEDEKLKIEPVSPPVLEKEETKVEVNQQEQEVKVSKVEIVEQKKESVSHQVLEKSEKDVVAKEEVNNVEEKTEDKKRINTMVIYPSAIPDSKNELFNNINSTLIRISKNKTEVVLTLSIEYTSFEKDLLLQYLEIIEKIKLSKIKVVFLIVNEQTSDTDEFIKKISSYVSVAKVVTFKELKMKSTYLDISIDLLLITNN